MVRPREPRQVRHDPLYLLAYVIVFLVLVYVLLRVAGAVS
jgi:hypothetical protein